ncbi:Bud-site selection protein [Lophiostoma macrostomum CBS 122681]|uniref:Bud-site selection protein n=1 Tax=Lophiostoma macrostomum CBS 122681 TaxID=1314788 RepID=A0A6A6SND0_9PLEO|nr:Bud-site selection protein [Lophiostoma macrostomum CBS 122681]
MPKRKRTQLSPSSEPSDGTPSPHTLARQKKLCTQRITTALKPLVSALRLGAGFERQKFSRRRNTAKEKSDAKAVERLDKEYAVLKSLDVPALAERHLRRTIGKVKSLKEHEALKEWLESRGGDNRGADTVWLNVTARLYKVTGVREVVDEVIEDLKGIVEVGGVTPGAKKDQRNQKDWNARKKSKVQDEVEAEEEEVEVASSDEEGEAFKIFDARIAAPSSAEEDSDDSLSEGHRPPSIGDSQDEWEGFEDADEDSASDSTENSEAVVFRKDLGRVNDDWSGGSEPDDSEEDHEPIPPPKAKAKEPATKASQSTFLPSLSHAAYFSGTESEASDLDIDVAPKKNRRGQRARQKIWEQKYGEKAKHVQESERNKGWDPKRGAVDGRPGKGGRGGKGGPKTGRGPERSGENATALGARKVTKRDDSGPIHPSWQAAKAAKERKMVVKPEGKKIVFD